MAHHLTNIEMAITWLFLVYLVVGGASYILLNIVAFSTIRDYIQNKRVDIELSLYSGLEPPISVIVPAFNEGRTIVASIQSILQLHYPNLEIIIVNDGSTDDTLEVLINAFDMKPFEEAVRDRIKTQSVHRVYLSRSTGNVRLLDKDNGGKADAINAGINISRSPLFCCVDADSVLEPSSLIRVVQPFLEIPDTVASGGTVRIANGCRVRYGHVISKGIPSNPLALFQLIEYLRAFLFGRVGWSRLKGLLIVSGAFGVFHKESVVAVGGYATGTIGEDMELIVRMHRLLPAQGRGKHIAFTPDPVCWTEAPEKMKDLRGQRIRWHRGLTESLWLNRGLLFAKDGGTAGWIAFPFFIVFEWLSPFVECAGYLFTVYLLVMTDMEFLHVAIIHVFAISLSTFLSTVGFMMDEFTFPGTTRIRDVLLMVLFSVLECFGYRQLNMYFRMRGALAWMTGQKSTWGSMSRSGSWQR